MNKSQVLVLLSILYISFFYNSGAMHVIRLNEVRNFVTVREMLESGNWLIPTMNGEVRITKPPLPTWLTLAGARVGGGVRDLAAMRFPAALMAAPMVLFTFFLGRALEFEPSVSYRSALILSTSVLMIQTGRNATWDIFTHSFMTGGLWAFVSGINHHKRSWILLTLAGTLMGLSFLSKGPVAFYTTLLPFILCYFFFYKPALERVSWKQVTWMILLCLVIASSWYAYIFSHHQDLLRGMLEKETGAWVTKQVHPPWYYLYFPIVTGVWALGCVAALMKPFGGKRIKPFKAYAFLLWWCVLTVVLLSIVPEKKPKYLFPLLIPISFMLGHLWTYWINAFRTKTDTVWDRRVISVHTVSVIVLSLSMSLLVVAGVFTDHVSTLQGILFGAILAVLGAMGIGLLETKEIHYVFSVTLILVCVSTLLVMQTLPYASYSKLEYAAPMRGAGTEPSIVELPLYSSVPMGIRSIWEIGRPVQHLTIDEVRDHGSCGPFALFTTEPPDHIEDVRDKFAWELIRIYPGRSKDQKWYLSVLSPHRISGFRQCVAGAWSR